MTVLTQFDVFSAARIAKAVRTVEDMKPAAKPLTFQTQTTETGKDLRRISWSGNWYTGQTITVTIRNGSAAGATLAARNEIIGLASGWGWASRNGGEMKLVSFDWTKLDNFDNSTSTATVQLLGARGGIAMWYDVVSCESTAA